MFFFSKVPLMITCISPQTLGRTGQLSVSQVCGYWREVVHSIATQGLAARYMTDSGTCQVLSVVHSIATQGLAAR